MIDHFNLPVTDLARSTEFTSVCSLYWARGCCIGMATRLASHRPLSFGLALTKAPVPRLHLAFRAASREMVDRFHAVALAAGAVNNGAPGLRAQYHPDYYGAFVLDPDGHIWRREQGDTLEGRLGSPSGAQPAKGHSPL